MSDETNATDGQSILENSPINKPASKKATPKKSKNTPIIEQVENQVQKRGALKQSELVKWTVFVRPEVKIAVQKAAKKGGITDTAWLDNALWEGATADLSKKVQPPAKVEDVADLIKGFAEQMEAKQAATVEQQNALIKQQGEQLAALTDAIKNQPAPPPPPSLKELIFGRSNKP